MKASRCFGNLNWRLVFAAIVLDKPARFLAKGSGNRGLNPGEGASPDSFFPSFRSAIAKSTIGGRERLFYENESFTHKKFNKPLAFAAPFSPHRLRGRFVWAFAEDAGTALAGTGWRVRENDDCSTGDAPFDRRE